MIFFLTIFQWFPISLRITERARLHYVHSAYFSRTGSLCSLPTVCFMTNFLLFFQMDVLSLASRPLPMKFPVRGIFFHSPLLLIVWLSAEASRVSRSLFWFPAPINGSLLFPNPGSVYCRLSCILVSPLLLWKLYEGRTLRVQIIVAFPLSQMLRKFYF